MDKDKNLRDLIAQKLKKWERLTVTLDYGVHHRDNPDDEVKIAEWAEKGLIEVSDTEATLEELKRADPRIKELLETKMERYPKLMPQDPAILGMARLGRFALGSLGTTRDGKHIYEIIEEFQSVMFPDFDKLRGKTRINAYHDVLHISCHYAFNRDVFLTRNLRHFEKVLAKHPDIVIASPEKFTEISKDCFKGEE